MKYLRHNANGLSDSAVIYSLHRRSAKSLFPLSLRPGKPEL